ncbi:retrovirus-related Pol polyprotein LINE-1 [Elysia marginata]|uniref:Retrovirus-related Pol polyprotein LINE-1 n=1 Tax=Elysia marginata TaxID=1093978 RepID=A0AAV4J4J9_9GAST|nr:retrovirus-related Pol polyprotein LINE-1 [Elysia marginata]
MKVNDLWNTLKSAVTDSMKEACGTKKQGGPTRKLTAWWNEEIKEVIQTKKKLFKKWVKSKSEEDYIQYRLARRDAKRKTRLSKEASWKKYGEDLSAMCKTSTRDFYKSVKAMRVRDNPFDPTSVVNNPKGQPLYEDDLIRGRWEEYFYDLLNPAGILDTGEGFDSSQPDHQEPNILESEVRWAVKDSPKDKAAGDDGITTRAALACREIGIQWLTLMFQRAWGERKVPDDWQRVIVVPIWKCKGSKKDCSTYRGISLLSHVGKMFAKILERRIRAKTEHLLSNSQFGFRKGRGCADAIFALRQLCGKTIEYNNELHLIFVDLEKAFDRVDRNKLWKVLECYGIHGQLLDSVRAIYKNSQSAVRTASGLTNWFPVTSGVRQGCVLSPLLFIIYMDRITQAANPDPECLNELLFADDQALFSPDKDTLQEHINQLNRQCEAHGMRINIKKTEAITISRNETTTAFNIEGNALLNATEFKYLGSFFTKDGRIDREIEVRCQKANSISYQLAPLLKHESIPHRHKSKAYKLHLPDHFNLPVSNLAPYPRTQKQASHMRNAMSQKDSNKTRRDKIRNEVIRAQVVATPVLQHV